ncbi:hypothetical protein ONZ45_g14066 [Pleurotus djamor]|nr:hypothetical protein ONZ45_g14066 [Pleurotus djamor]
MLKSQAILNLCRKRNSLTAIYGLPEDILSLIFVICKDSSEVTDVPILWQAILSVCSQWRHLALASPRFSNTIILSHTRNLLAMLVHSGQAPIHLYYPLNEIYAHGTQDKGKAAFRDALNKGGDRLERLIVTCTTENAKALDELFDALRTYRAPSLQEMSLRHKGPHHGRIYIRRQPLPWTSMPSIRHLTLHNTLIPLDMPPLPYLTSLTLTCNRLLSGEGIHIPYAVRFLHKTPNVEVVDIAHIVEPWVMNRFPGADIRIPDDSILLSRLRSLTITSDPINGSKFMNCLRLPGSARVRVHLSKKMRSLTTSAITQKRLLAKASLSSLLSTLGASSPDLTCQDITVTFGFGKSTLCFVVRLGALDPDMIHVDIAHQDHILDLCDYMDILESSQFKSHAVRLILFNGQTNVGVSGDVDPHAHRDEKKLEAMEGDRWAKLLPTFESLRTLCILNTSLSFFIKILLPSPVTMGIQEQDQDHLTVPAPFLEFNQNPLLQSIKLTDVECRPSAITTPVGASDVASTSLTSVVDEIVEEIDDSRLTVMKEVGMEDENLDKGQMEDEEYIGLLGGNLVDLAYTLKKRQEAGMPRIRLIFERCGSTPRQLLFLADYAKVELRNK